MACCADVLRVHRELFIKEKWSSEDAQYREDSLCLLAANLAIAMSIPLVGISFFEGMQSNRGYILDDDYIYINQDVLMDTDYMIDAIDTVLHEMRHKYQKESIIFPQYYDVDAKTVEVWKENFEHYVDSKWNFEAYINQPVEKDAREFAKSIIECVLK